jgi:hypothetical protein
MNTTIVWPPVRATALVAVVPPDEADQQGADWHALWNQAIEDPAGLTSSAHQPLVGHAPPPAEVHAPGVDIVTAMPPEVGITFSPSVLVVTVEEVDVTDIDS